MNIQILKKELLSNLQSLRFSAILIITTVLFIMNGLIFSGVYSEKLKDYSQKKEKHRKLKVSHFTNLGKFYADRRPNPLLFCVEGGESFLSSTLLIETTGILSPDPFIHEERNFTLPSFEEIDWMFIVKILFSLFAIILTYDAVSGEKERGTLSLILSNSIPRASIIFTKYLATLITITIPLVIGMLLGLLSLRGDVIALDGQSWARIGFFVLMSMVYISLFIFLSLFVSSLSHRSSISLLLQLSVWMVFVIVIPSSSPLLAEQLKKVPSEFEFGKQKEHIMYSWWKQELENRISTFSLKLNGFNEPSEEMKREAIEVINETGERIFDLTKEHEKKEEARFSMARNIAKISPSSIFQYTGEAIANSGIFRQRSFERAARNYYYQWQNYVQEKGGAFIKYPSGGPSVWRTLNIKLFGETITISIQPPEPKGDMSDAPVFRELKSSIIKGLSESIVNIFILFLWNVAFLLLAHVAFLRYDVR